MRRLLLAVVVALSGQHTIPPGPVPVPVVVELFTSEGCSSCPPADAVLSRLAREQPVPGVQIIPLGMHVTYWDQLGWKDPASLRQATDRQQDYSRVFGAARVYTPQAVVDGREELIGSDETGLKRAIAQAAKLPHLHTVLTASIAGDGIYATITTANMPMEWHEGFRTVLVLTEDGVSSIVKRGENGGRTLRHDAVVRKIAIEKEGLGKVAAHWRRDRLKLTAIVQGVKSRHVYSAATVALQ
jgi:hypothetical protein